MDNTGKAAVDYPGIMRRLRVFAGPNGSGKTTLYQRLLSENHFHSCTYINADEIEAALNDARSYPLPDCVDTESIQKYLATSPFQKYQNSGQLSASVSVSRTGISLTSGAAPSPYLAAAIADAIRNSLIGTEHSFAFETVMSDPSKVEFLAKAKHAGFRVYLYFVTTGDVSINIHRVVNRVIAGGHGVPEDKIIDRYQRVMDHLFSAIRQTDRTYLFDNSGEAPCLFASVANATTIDIHTEQVPEWFDSMLQAEGILP